LTDITGETAPFVCAALPFGTGAQLPAGAAAAAHQGDHHQGVELVRGFAHSGMVMAAHGVLASVRQSVCDARAEWPWYGLMFTGHSLGGGVAALCALELQSSIIDPGRGCYIHHRRSGGGGDGDGEAVVAPGGGGGGHLKC
jgi:hypothetical protein